MASSGSLDPVRLKIVWAQKHFDRLVSVMDGYFKSEPCDVVSDLDLTTNQVINTRIVIKIPIPPEFPLLVGDCLQNLRTALDYLIWELVLAANNGPDQKNAFPICTTKLPLREGNQAWISLWGAPSRDYRNREVATVQRSEPQQFLSLRSQ
jgi:hypothetical protein